MFSAALGQMVVGFFCLLGMLCELAFGSLGELPTEDFPSLSLKQRWEQEQKGPHSTLRSRSFALLTDRHVLFVSGILNELAIWPVRYFSANRLSVERDFGSTSSVLFPSSANFHENANVIRDKLWRLFWSSGQSIIVVAHSKGGAEVLYALLKYPELVVNGVVECVVLIQGAVGGSLLAQDQLWGLWPIRGFSYFLRRGLQAMVPSETRRLIQEGLDSLRSQQALAEISQRIFYVRSYNRLFPMSLGLQILEKVVWEDLSRFGLNDGVLLLEDQWEPRVGVDLGVIEADHMELVVSGPLSRASDADREALMRAVFGRVSELQTF